MTRDVGTQARDNDSNGPPSIRRKYKKNQNKPQKGKGNPKSYRFAQFMVYFSRNAQFMVYVSRNEKVPMLKIITLT